MDVRQNTLIAWPKMESQEARDTKALTSKQLELEKFRFERIVYVDTPNNAVWAIDVHDPKAWPARYTLTELTDCITSDAARIVVGFEPYPMISLTDEELGPDFAKYIEYRNNAWRLIETLFLAEIRTLFSRQIRGALIAEISRRTGRDKSKIRFQLRRFWQRGCTKNALFPDWNKRGLKGTETPGHKKRGRPTIEKTDDGQPVGVNVTAKDKEYFRRGIAEFVTAGTSSDLKAAWIRIKEQFYTTGSFIRIESDDGVFLAPELLPHTQLPTLAQFLYYYHKWRDPAKEIITQEGQDEYDRNCRPVLGSVFEEAPYPGALYQIDAAIGNVCLVSDFQRERLIGRPVIYIVIDTFSRKIVGWSVTLEGPSWTGARLALEMAFEREGFCEALIGDNGEIKSYNANSLVDPLRIRVVNAPAYRPDWKPIVERSFLTIKGEYVDFVPGRVVQRRKVRGPDFRLEARVALQGFRKIFGKSVDHYNGTHWFTDYPLSAHMIQHKVKPIPDALWQYGIENLAGPPRAVESIERMKLCLLPKDRASVHKGEGGGIYFKGLYYVCKRGLEEGWFERIASRPRQSFAVAYEQTVDRIFLCMDHGRSFEECVLTDPYKRFSGKDWFDVRDYFAWKHIADKNAIGLTQQPDAEFHADIENVIAQEIAATAAALAASGISRNERLRGLKLFREQLKGYERKFGPVPKVMALNADNSEPPSTQSSTRDARAPVKMPDAYVPPANPSAEIRAARQKAKEQK